MEINHGIIVAAGLGTRMQEVCKQENVIAKEMLEVNYEPLLFRLIGQMSQCVKQITIVLSPAKKDLETTIRLRLPEVNIKFVYQDKPLGTGHAVRCAKITEPAIITWGDSWFSTTAFRSFVGSIKSNKTKLTIFENDSLDYGHVDLKTNKFIPKGQPGKYMFTGLFFYNLVNGIPYDNFDEVLQKDEFSTFLFKSGEYYDCGNPEALKETRKAVAK